MIAAASRGRRGRGARAARRRMGRGGDRVRRAQARHGGRPSTIWWSIAARGSRGYKKPRAVRFVASLPRSHYGKVIRAELLAAANGDRGPLATSFATRHRCSSHLILASVMICAYFAISTSMYLANSIRRWSRSARSRARSSRSFTSGIASTLAMSACSLRRRRPAGSSAPTARTRTRTQSPSSPDSSTVGISGAAAARLRLVRPRALILPALRQRQRRQHRIGQQLNLPAHQVGQRRRGAFVGDDQRVELASRLSSSIARWLAEPRLVVPKVNFFGSLRTRSKKSLRVVGRHARRRARRSAGRRRAAMTGVKSFTTS